jgi:hypothetical protein
MMVIHALPAEMGVSPFFANSRWPREPGIGVKYEERSLFEAEIAAPSRLLPGNMTGTRYPARAEVRQCRRRSAAFRQPSMDGCAENRPRKGSIMAPGLLMTASTAAGAVSTAEVTATAKARRRDLRRRPILLRRPLLWRLIPLLRLALEALSLRRSPVLLRRPLLWRLIPQLRLALEALSLRRSPVLLRRPLLWHLIPLLRLALETLSLRRGPVLLRVPISLFPRPPRVTVCVRRCPGPVLRSRPERIPRGHRYAPKPRGYLLVPVWNAQAMTRIVRPDRSPSKTGSVAVAKSIARKEGIVDIHRVAEPARAPSPTAPTTPAAPAVEVETKAEAASESESEA